MTSSHHNRLTGLESNTGKKKEGFYRNTNTFNISPDFKRRCQEKETKLKQRQDMEPLKDEERADSHLDFVQIAGGVTETEVRLADPLKRPLKVMLLDQLAQEADYFTLLLGVAELQQEVSPAPHHRLGVLVRTDGQVEVVAESVKEGLGCELS